MVSLEDRMRENRRVLAEITETQRTIAQDARKASSEFVALAELARRLRTVLYGTGCVLLLVGFVGGAGAWLAAEFLSGWVGSFFR